MDNELKAMAETLRDWHKRDRLNEETLTVLRSFMMRDILEAYAPEWAGITYDLGDGKITEVANDIRKDAARLSEV
jgi:hypothetical protein